MLRWPQAHAIPIYAYDAPTVTPRWSFLIMDLMSFDRSTFLRARVLMAMVDTPRDNRSIYIDSAIMTADG